jgi:hypothetical protein
MGPSRNTAHSPPFSRRGGCAINQMPRSHISGADGVVSKRSRSEASFDARARRARSLLPLVFDLIQQLFDPQTLFDRFVIVECQFRNPLHVVQALA